MKKEVIAGIVFMVIWISFLLVLSASKNVVPDLRTNTIDNPNYDCETDYGLGGAFCK